MAERPKFLLPLTVIRCIEIGTNRLLMSLSLYCQGYTYDLLFLSTAGNFEILQADFQSGHCLDEGSTNVVSGGKHSCCLDY
jgi:hypothetical protein